MDSSFNIVRIILIVSFAIYEFWAFKNRKSLGFKLIPFILAIALGLLLLVLVSFLGSIGYFFIFIILISEVSLMGAILVILIEICMSLFSVNRNLKRVLILTAITILMIVVYYLSQKVF